jgi:hypothetical protein
LEASGRSQQQDRDQLDAAPSREALTLPSPRGGGSFIRGGGRLIASWLLLLPLAALLVYLLIHLYPRVDPTHGFDYQGHLDYIRFIDMTASLPLANQGWEMYHPPAYWALTAIIFEAIHRVGVALTLTDAGQALSTAAWILEGVIAAAVVRVFGGNSIGAAAAAALTWLLIGQSIVGTALYNETLTGLGLGTLILGAALWYRGRRIGLLLLGIGFPLAILSKYSGLVAALVAAPLIIWWSRDRLKPTLIALLPGAVLGALYYGRNLLVFGTPLPTNIELFNLRSWDPLGWGHPAGYFTSLSPGYCAATHSFWLGLWKWLWATDCFPIAPWRNVVEEKLLVVALATTIIILAALVWGIWHSRRDPGVLVLPATGVAIIAAYILYNVRWPAISSDKGIYLLAAIVPVAAVVGLLVDRLSRRAPAALISYGAILGWSAFMVRAALG